MLESIFKALQEVVGSLNAVFLLNLHLDLDNASELVEEPKRVVLAKDLHRPNETLDPLDSVLLVDLQCLEHGFLDDHQLLLSLLEHDETNGVSDQDLFSLDEALNLWNLHVLDVQNFVHFFSQQLNLVRELLFRADLPGSHRVEDLLDHDVGDEELGVGLSARDVTPHTPHTYSIGTVTVFLEPANFYTRCQSVSSLVANGAHLVAQRVIFGVLRVY